MANSRNANTYYVDSTTSTLAVPNIKLMGLIITATAATGRVVLSDVTTALVKIDARVVTSGDTLYMDFSLSPIVFPNGINPTTVSNAVATCIIQESRG